MTSPSRFFFLLFIFATKGIESFVDRLLVNCWPKLFEWIIFWNSDFTIETILAIKNGQLYLIKTICKVSFLRLFRQFVYSRAVQGKKRHKQWQRERERRKRVKALASVCLTPPKTKPTTVNAVKKKILKNEISKKCRQTSEGKKGEQNFSPSSSYTPAHRRKRYKTDEN